MNPCSLCGLSDVLSSDGVCAHCTRLRVALRGLIAMGDAISKRMHPKGSCHRCGSFGALDAGHEDYDNEMYTGADENTYCGYCADYLQIDLTA